jgi:hypothetical protein
MKSAAVPQLRPRLIRWYECAGCRTGCMAKRPANAKDPTDCIEGIHKAQWIKVPGGI